MSPAERLAALIEEYARRTRCGFCGAQVGEPCHVYGHPNQRAQRTHSPRMVHWHAFWEAWSLGREHGLQQTHREAAA